jgi:hypothetical protein
VDAVDSLKLLSASAYVNGDFLLIASISEYVDSGLGVNNRCERLLFASIFTSKQLLHATNYI